MSRHVEIVSLVRAGVSIEYADRHMDREAREGFIMEFNRQEREDSERARREAEHRQSRHPPGMRPGM